VPQGSCKLHFVYFVGKYTINIRHIFLLGLFNDISSTENTIIRRDYDNCKQKC